MNFVSDADLSDAEVMAFLAEQESQEVKAPSHWREELLAQLRNPTESTGITLPFPKTHSMVRLRPAETSVWFGPNGHFKSSLINQVGLYATRTHKIGVMSFEMPVPVTLERMTRQAAGTGNPPAEYADKLLGYLDNRMWIYDHLDSVEPERALACVHYMASQGIDLIILDCLIMVKGITRDTEREAKFMAHLTALAKAHNTHIALVHHMRKPGQGGDEYIPTRWDMRGASDLSDMASSVFIVWNNKAKASALRKQEVNAPLTSQEADALERPCQLLIAAKQRNAPFEGAIGLNLNRPAMQFRESERHKLHMEVE